MSSRRYVMCGVSVAAILVLGSAAWATLDNLKTYKQAYPDKAAKASCKTCHQDAIGKKGNLNAYGLALQQSKAPADAKKLTTEEIEAVPQGEKQ